jgi:nickel-dependent lactate racemase
VRVFLPYGSSHITCEIPDSRLRAILSPKLPEAEEKTGEAIVRASLARPAGSPPLRELAGGKKNVVILSSDHTRPVPSAVIMPLLLEEIRGIPGRTLPFSSPRDATGAPLTMNSRSGTALRLSAP